MSKIGRNDLCPCGSGRKYKRCCLPAHEAAAAQRAAATQAAAAAEAAARRAPPVVAWEEDDDDLDEASNRVVDLIHAGQLDEAEQAARDLLARYPEVHVAQWSVRWRLHLRVLALAVLVPLVEGLHAFAGRDWPRVIARIEPLGPRIIELGGSRAQRDVFHDTLIEACFRGGDMDRAERLVAERVQRRPDHFWVNRRQAGAAPPPD